jgi:hypothetical protein
MPSPVDVLQFVNSHYSLRAPAATSFFLLQPLLRMTRLRAVPRQAGSLGVNARRFDGFDAAEAPVAVIDGKNLW